MLDNQVADTFSNAASYYKQHDVLQRLTAQRIFDSANFTGTLLDVGAGPGTCFKVFKSVENVVAVDIAQGMLVELNQHFNDYLPLCSDAQALGLQTASIDSIYSNLALQWCQSFPKAIEEFHRVLRPSSECYISVVAEGSLPELRTLGFRTNSFMSLSAMLAAFTDGSSNSKWEGEWQVLMAVVESITVYFDDLRSLLYSIKGVGASSGNETIVNFNKMLTKGSWQSRLALAETMRTEQGIPLTYKVAYIRAKRGE